MKIQKQEIEKLKTKWKGKIFLSNKTIVKFSMDKKNGWMQWGGAKDDLWITVPIIENLWNEFVKQQEKI